MFRAIELHCCHARSLHYLHLGQFKYYDFYGFLFIRNGKFFSSLNEDSSIGFNLQVCHKVTRIHMDLIH